MKNLLLLFSLIFVLSCCDKDTFGGDDQLPPETQTGANTVGCLVNGKVFLPKKEGISPEVNCFYQLVDGKYFFTMAFSDRRGSQNKTINIFTQNIILQVNQTYTLNKGYNPGNGGGAEYFTDVFNTYNTNSSKIGELKITKLDTTNSIISGTFWFDAINTAGEIVEIRKGRFDLRY